MVEIRTERRSACEVEQMDLGRRDFFWGRNCSRGASQNEKVPAAWKRLVVVKKGLKRQTETLPELLSRHLRVQTISSWPHIRTDKTFFTTDTKKTVYTCSERPQKFKLYLLSHFHTACLVEVTESVADSDYRRARDVVVHLLKRLVVITVSGVYVCGCGKYFSLWQKITSPPQSKAATGS